MDYEKDIRIDESALDVELLQQASLTFEYIKYEAVRKRAYDRLKEQSDLLKAELDKKIRRTPEKYGIDKITESVVQATIIQQEEYQDLQNEMIECKYEMNIASAAVRSLDVKKSALEHLVKLFGQQYFAGPDLPRQLDKEWEKRENQKSTNKKIGSGMKRGAK